MRPRTRPLPRAARSILTASQNLLAGKYRDPNVTKERDPAGHAAREEDVNGMIAGALEATSAVFGRAGVAGPGEPSLVEFVVRGALEARRRPQLARAPALRRAGEAWASVLDFGLHAMSTTPAHAAVAAGFNHSLLINKDGALFSFGHGGAATCLGHGDEANQPRPKRVMGLLALPAACHLIFGS